MYNYVNNTSLSGPADTLLGSLQINRLVRENLKNYDRIISNRNRRIHLHDICANQTRKILIKSYEH